MAVAIVVCVFILSPFLIYEIQHNFQDIRGSIGTLAYGSDKVFSKRAYVRALGNSTITLWKTCVVLKNQLLLLVLAAIALCSNVIKRNNVQILATIGFCFGIGALAFYKDTIQPQYSYQLIPFVFFLVAGLLDALPKRIKIATSILLVIVVSYLSWVVVRPYAGNDFDIPRLTRISTKVAQLTKNAPFSFIVINSRSFNDLHMRYFFHLYNMRPLPFDDVSYKTLLIVCENECPEQLGNKVDVMCSGEICPLDKPSINLTQWVYEKTERVGTSAIFIYTR